MWSVEPEQIWGKPRRSGISGYMRLRNEAEFLDRAIATHIDGLDELVLVHNDCTDGTPNICQRWKRKYPEKIIVAEYEPSVVAIGTAESRTIETESLHCFANYSNYALSLTNSCIVLKIDGDHHAITRRFCRTCRYVRRYMPPTHYYSLFGLNITYDHGEIVVYNFYDYAPRVFGDRPHRMGPTPFTQGDQAFHYVDRDCGFSRDPIDGFEVPEFVYRKQRLNAPMTYAFFHLKGMKRDRGTGNYEWSENQKDHQHAVWVRNALAVEPKYLATVEAVRRHNPFFFRSANVYKELRDAFPELSVRMPKTKRLPPLSLRERAASLWYRVAFM